MCPALVPIAQEHDRGLVKFREVRVSHGGAIRNNTTCNPHLISITIGSQISNPLLFTSSKNSLQLDADSLSRVCRPRTSLWPDSVTSTATKTGIFLDRISNPPFELCAHY